MPLLMLLYSIHYFESSNFKAKKSIPIWILRQTCHSIYSFLHLFLELKRRELVDSFAKFPHE